MEIKYSIKMKRPQKDALFRELLGRLEKVRQELDYYEYKNYVGENTDYTYDRQGYIRCKGSWRTQRLPEFERKVLEAEAYLVDVKDRIERFGSITTLYAESKNISNEIYNGIIYKIAELLGIKIREYDDNRFRGLKQSADFIFADPGDEFKLNTLETMLRAYGEEKRKDGYKYGSDMLSRFVSGDITLDALNNDLERIKREENSIDRSLEFDKRRIDAAKTKKK